MRKKQLTMQQGLALGCLILLVCAVLFGIVLREIGRASCRERV